MGELILTQEQNGYRLPEIERRELLSKSDNPAGKFTPKMRAKTELKRKKFIARSGNSLEL